MQTVTVWVMGVALAFLPIQALGQGAAIGEAEYMNSCAQCHGAGGTGDGPMVNYLSGTMPDLTTLQSRNGGVFPVARIYGVIDGSEAVGAHGSSEMPAWGWRYTARAPQVLGYEFTAGDQEAYVRGRILALVEFLATFQQ